MQKKAKTSFLSRRFFDLAILFVLALIPFLWVKNGAVILGHDAGLPISPTAHFLDRLHTWTDRYGAGSDQSFALGGFFLHGFEALIDQTKLPLSTQQAIQFSTYFFLFGVSMYVFSSVVFHDHEKYSYIPLCSALLYQLNHFILQAWFIAERTKFQMYIALPLVLLCLWLLFVKRKSPIILGIAVACIVSLLNGGGFIPLYGAIFLASGIFTLVHLITEKKPAEALVRFLLFSLTSGVLALALQAYWLLPYINYVKGAFSSEVAAAGGINGVINWVYSISENTSYLNIMRLQGIQEWYVNPEHPYAQAYFNSPILVMVSFFWILIPFLALLWKKKNERRILVTLTAILATSVVFMAGSHPPFGQLYIFLIRHVPGFIAFRTPYYKFAPAFMFSISVLFGYVINHLMNGSKTSNIPKFVKMLVPILLICGYMFPFFSVNFFQYTKQLSTKLSLPSYVTEYARYVQQEPRSPEYTMLLPGNDPDRGVHYYQWGYWSLASIHSLLDQRAYISASAQKDTRSLLVRELYVSILDQKSNWESLARRLGIKFFLVQKDIVPYLYEGRMVRGEFFEEAMKKSSDVAVVKSFGPWTLYQLNDAQAFWTTSSLVQVFDDAHTIGLGSLLDELKISTDSAVALIGSGAPQDLISHTILFPECQDCQMLRSPTYTAERDIITPASFLYPLQKGVRILRESIKKPSVGYLASQSLKGLYNLESMLEKKTPLQAKIVAWNVYLQHLQKYADMITPEIEKEEASLAHNDLLQSIYVNLLEQSKRMKNFAEEINRQEESDLFFQAQNLVTGLRDRLAAATVITQELHQNEYLIEVPESATYSAYVHLPSTNYQYQAHKSAVKFAVNSTFSDYQQPRTGEWVNLGKHSLQQGLQRFTLIDVPYPVQPNLQDFFSKNAIASNPDGSFKIKYGGKSGCYTIPVGSLNDSTFIVSLSVRSASSFGKPTFHLRYEGDITPILPFWGVSEKISDGSWTRITLETRKKIDTPYAVYVCNQSSNSVEELFIKDISVDHVTQPTLAFVHEENAGTLSAVKTHTNAPLSVERKSNDLYNIQIASGSPKILVSQLQLTPEWRATILDTATPAHTLLGKKSFWILPENKVPYLINLEYRPQRLFVLGAILSAGTVIGISLVLGIHFWKKRT